MSNFIKENAKKIAFVSAFCGIFLSGCAKQIVESKIEIPKLSCDKVEVIAQDSESNGFEINKDEILALLQARLNDNCHIFKEDTKVKLSFQSTLEENLETTTFVKKESKVAKVTIHLTFTQASRISQAKGASSLNINGKKVLGIGKNTTIPKEDKDMLISNAFESAWSQAEKVFASK